MAIPLIAKTIVGGMNFNDAGREAWWCGCEPTSSNAWKIVPLSSVSWTQPARFLHLERHVDDPLLLQMLAPKFAQP
jgi:hypothetical protein